MKPIQKEDILNIRMLRSKGNTFKGIAKKLKFSPSTIHKYSKNIKAIIIVKNKCKRIKKQRFDLNTPKIRLIGYCLWDGYVGPERNKNYCIAYTNCSIQLIKQFIKDMGTVYGIKPNQLKFKKGKCIDYFEVRFYSKLACIDLLKYFRGYSTSKIKDISIGLLIQNKYLAKEFLRSFWEDEGSVSSYGRIKASLKNKSILLKLKELHSLFKISCSVGYDKCTNVYYLQLHKNRDNLKNFWSLSPFIYSVIKRGNNVGQKRKTIFLNHCKDYLNLKKLKN